MRQSPLTQEETALASLYKQPGVAFIIPGAVFTLIGLPPALGYPADTWEIMGRTIPPSDCGLPFALVGIMPLLIGAVITCYYSRKKEYYEKGVKSGGRNTCMGVSDCWPFCYRDIVVRSTSRNGGPL